MSYLGIVYDHSDGIFPTSQGTRDHKSRFSTVIDRVS